MRNRIPLAFRDDVSREGCTRNHTTDYSRGCGVINNGVRKESAEVALSFRKCWYLGLIHERAADASPLIICEEEEFVVNDRSAKSEAELVLTEGGLLVSGELKIVSGIEDVIPEELEHASMKLIAARFNGGIDDRSATASELRRVVTGLYFKLSNRVDVGLQDVAAVVVRIVVDAIEDEIV